MTPGPCLRLLDGGLERPDVQALLRQHLAQMRAASPAESVHAVDLDALRAPGVVFVTALLDHTAAGVGALAPLWPRTSELKSMHTAAQARGRGVGSSVLTRLLATARSRHDVEVRLETGTSAEFDPAHRLYARHGFVQCGPFGGYKEDPHSAFYRLSLGS